MKIRIHIFVSLLVCLFGVQTETLSADSSDSSEYQMKAAYIYKCMQFIQLPDINRPDNGGKDLRGIIVGITDKNRLNIFRKTIGGKEITQHKEKYKIMVEYVDVKQLKDQKTMSKLDVLFFCNSGPKSYSTELLRSTIDNNIVAFGETRGFLEDGGIVNFVILKNKLRFEINAGTAKQADIKIRSQLSRIAIRVIDKKSKPQKAKN